MTAAADEGTRVPVVLPHLRITITAAGELEALLDKTPYDVPAAWAGLGRGAVPRIIDEVTARLASPVRVDVLDGDTAFTDIVTPTAASPQVTPGQSPTRVAGEVIGGGFLPGEAVAIAIVAGHTEADAAGIARLRLPPPLLAGRAGVVVLLGENSGTVARTGGTS